MVFDFFAAPIFSFFFLAIWLFSLVLAVLPALVIPPRHQRPTDSFRDEDAGR